MRRRLAYPIRLTAHILHAATLATDTIWSVISGEAR